MSWRVPCSTCASPRTRPRVCRKITRKRSLSSQPRRRCSMRSGGSLHGGDDGAQGEERIRAAELGTVEARDRAIEKERIAAVERVPKEAGEAVDIDGSLGEGEDD